MLVCWVCFLQVLACMLLEIYPYLCKEECPFIILWDCFILNVYEMLSLALRWPDKCISNVFFDSNKIIRKENEFVLLKKNIKIT